MTAHRRLFWISGVVILCGALQLAAPRPGFGATGSANTAVDCELGRCFDSQPICNIHAIACGCASWSCDAWYEECAGGYKFTQCQES